MFKLLFSATAIDCNIVCPHLLFSLFFIIILLFSTTATNCVTSSVLIYSAPIITNLKRQVPPQLLMYKYLVSFYFCSAYDSSQIIFDQLFPITNQQVPV